MIMVGKVFIAFIWTFWMIVTGSVAEGQNVSPEYIPTYGSTYDRVIKRGYLICGTNDEFPGFSQETFDSEDGENVASMDGVLSAEELAEVVMKALEDERFHVLPHPDVEEYVRRKGDDVDRWLLGMRRFQNRLFPEGSTPADWLLS